jgi:hypothetical protein
MELWINVDAQRYAHSNLTTIAGSTRHLTALIESLSPFPQRATIARSCPCCAQSPNMCSAQERGQLTDLLSSKAAPIFASSQVVADLEEEPTVALHPFETMTLHVTMQINCSENQIW